MSFWAWSTRLSLTGKVGEAHRIRGLNLRDCGRDKSPCFSPWLCQVALSLKRLEQKDWRTEVPTAEGKEAERRAEGDFWTSYKDLLRMPASSLLSVWSSVISFLLPCLVTQAKGCILIVEHLPSTCEALCSISSIVKSNQIQWAYWHGSLWSVVRWLRDITAGVWQTQVCLDS